MNDNPFALLMLFLNCVLVQYSHFDVIFVVVEIVVWVNVIFETKRFVIRILEQVHIKVGIFIN